MQIQVQLITAQSKMHTALFLVETKSSDTINELKFQIRAAAGRPISTMELRHLSLFKLIAQSTFDTTDRKKSFERIDFEDSNTVREVTLIGSVGSQFSNNDVVFVRFGTDEDEVDKVAELDGDEFKRFSTVLNAPGKTPSAGAKSANYVKSQGNAATTIFDGRGAKGKPPTIGPPIHIFHPIFSDFARLVDSSDIPTYEDLTSVLELMRFASEVHRPEDNYGDGLRRHLTRILRITIHQDPNPDGSRPDGIISAELDGDKFPFVFIELKREIGEGGCDPTTQAGVSMRRSWIHSSRARLRDKCCCPTFLIAAGGAWLSVLGGVFTDKFIVQRLTSMRWIGISSTAEFNRVYHNAKVLIALRKCIQTLRSYYESDSKTDPLGTSHPRFFPHPTSFTAGDGTSTSFRYLKALENYPSCVTYLAEIIDQSGATDTRDKVVVKFVMRYGEQVHKFLAEHGRAPTLRYYGPLPKHTLFDRFLGHTENITLGPHFEPNIMNMVVMDYIQATPRPKLPQNAISQIGKVLTLLHKNGYVFGDLRLPNVLLDAKDEVKFIDFDWCGEYDRNIDDADDKIEHFEHVHGGDGPYARYPLEMSTVPGLWATGMQAFAEIRPKHDWEMLDKLKSN